MSDQSAPSGPDTTAPADTGTMPDAAQDATATAPDQPEQQAPQTDEYRQRLEQQLQQMAQSNQTLMERFDALQQRIPEPEPEQEWEPEPGDDGAADYKAHVADQRAQQETPAGTRREVQLESAAGAAPADRDEDIQDRIARRRRAASPRI
jgi:hypothetical protein